MAAASEHAPTGSGGANEEQQEMNKHNETAPSQGGVQSMEATSRSDESVRTPRTEAPESAPAKDPSHESPETPGYFTSIAHRKSSSGFLASLTASNISSPLQSTYASSASLQSSDDHATGQINVPRHTNTPPTRETMAHASPRIEPTYPAASPSEVPPYPDQSHAALQSQAATFPYAYLQARNSDYAGKAAPSGSPGQSSDHLSSASASISADHTPLQSPGLFQPKSKADKGLTEPSGPSLLHPTHRAHVTKETTKLIKDFDQVTGNKIMNDYEVFEKLGTGSYGAVKRARNLVTNQDVAIKILKRTGPKGRLGSRLGKHETPEDKIKKEVAVLKKARHPHVVSLLEVIDDPEKAKVYLVLEYVERGEIIWRTETTRDIARFEMKRVARELAGPVDELYETMLANHFNEESQKKLEMAVAASQHRSGISRLFDDGFGLNIQSANDLVFGWSNEAGGNESDAEHERRAYSATRRARQDLPNALDTPRPTDEGFAQAGVEGFPDIASALAGSQYGPYATDVEPEWTPDENGYKYVPCMTMAQVRDAFRDTVLGLEYLHYHGIIHRDIKPANLLWTKDYRVMISDFGVSYVGEPIRVNEGHGPLDSESSNFSEDRELAKTVGTPAFYAPELCDPARWDTEAHDRRKVTGQIDIWALGVSLYAMIYGRLPFFDENDEWGMYERIARQDAFLSSKRLHGVDEHNRASPGKRKPHLVAYEDVDDDLKDLLKRLLIKDPRRRATLVEIKHHPWLLFGLEDPERWVRDTDPALRSEGKIEVSKNEVDVALAPLNLVDRIKHTIRRFGSVVTRGRESRRRADSAVKDHSGSNSSRSTTIDREARRQSLRGDEQQQIWSALRASRETYDHPLSHSVMASPVVERTEPQWVKPIAHLEMPSGPPPASASPNRPMVGERQESTTESVRTIRPHTATGGTPPTFVPPPTHEENPPQPGSAASSSSGLSTLLGVASRRLASTMRRDRPNSSRDNSNHSSRSSSVENMAASYEDTHAFPSVAFSPAVAAGQVDYGYGTEYGAMGPPEQPAAYAPSNHPRVESSPGAFARARAQNFRKMISEHQQAASHPPSSTNTAVREPQSAHEPCPPSPDDNLGLYGRGQPMRQRAVTEPNQPGSSAEDVYALSESASNPSIPSTSTSTSQPDHASSMLATADTITASTFTKGQGRRPDVMKTAGSDELIMAAQHPPANEGCPGDGDGNDGSVEADDEGSDDEGIVMGGRK